MSRAPKEFKVNIPEDRTAQYPAEMRDDSRLLIVDRGRKTVNDAGRFRNIVEYIGGDLILINETRVLPVSVDGRRSSGGKINILFLSSDIQTIGLEGEIEALVNPGRRLRSGVCLHLPDDARLLLKDKTTDGKWRGTWLCGESKRPFAEWLYHVGQPPLPPYIRRPVETTDVERYQTVYARQPGSLAAPTAGFHFTRELIDKLITSGCDIVSITLDVGLGTFIPIRSEDLSAHRMHEERYYIPNQTIEQIDSAKQSSRNITVVGTTVVRALEDAAADGLPIRSGEYTADIFIYPPYQFKVVDRLLTNFHRPDSTLLQLTAALIGWDLLNLAYQTALEGGFRFYSYGDAMLIV
ncbi:MAG: tRNA preQ1(34) S-adenosylmethionine ribosyltransferase-isomerase QueA [Candidatus Hatepunaea meridiana]|nr:tRNA preQ1(34) S-adenosylmethionine ribosyltransferase-isomerase QueA [Candidatus Hatepunaea meridiana]